MVEQAQTAGEDQVGDWPQAVVTYSQFPSINNISEQERAEIARKKVEAIKRLLGKKPRDETEFVECVKQKRQNDKEKELISALEKLEKRKLGEVEETEQGHESTRKKSDGQDGYKQLGCSTHKGIS